MATETHPMNIEDMLTFQRLCELEVCGDSGDILVNVRDYDLEENKASFSFHKINTNGVDGEDEFDTRLTTLGPGHVSNPCYHDGEVFFLREGQICCLPVNGDSYKITSFDCEVDMLR